MKHKLNQVCYQNRYSQLDAESIMELASQSSDVKLLPSSKNYDLFTSFDEAGDLVCNGEVITLGKARYANIKYWCGDFISSNNNIIESKNTNFLRSKYLYYFLSYTAKDYYVEATTYPKFDQSNFDNHTIDIPSIDTQDSRLNILNSLVDLIQKETLQLDLLDELTKSRFNELFGPIQYMSDSNRSIGEVCELNPKKESLDDNIDITFIPMEKVGVDGSLKLDSLRKYGDIKKGFSQIKEDDVLFAKITPCMENGKATIARGLINGYAGGTTELFVIRCGNEVLPEYIFHIVHSQYFRDKAKPNMRGTVGQQRVGKEFIESFPIDVPNLERQKDFSTFVKEIDKLKFSI